jgi:hypothetical protein
MIVFTNDSFETFIDGREGGNEFDNSLDATKERGHKNLMDCILETMFDPFTSLKGPNATGLS